MHMNKVSQIVLFSLFAKKVDIFIKYYWLKTACLSGSSVGLNILKIMASLIYYDVLLNTAMFLELNFALEKYAGATIIKKNLMPDFF